MPNLFAPPSPPPVGYACVALERGIDLALNGLTYAIPSTLPDLQVGQRVLVPLGKNDRTVAGIVTEIYPPRSEGGSSPNPSVPQTPDDADIKPIYSRDPGQLSLTEDLVHLARWMSQYYCCPLGMVFVTMIPSAVKKGTGTIEQTMVGLPQPATDQHGPSPPEADASAPSLTKLQQAVLDRVRELADQGEPWIEIHRLADLAGARTVGPVKTLVKKGLLTIQHQQAVRAMSREPTNEPAPEPDQGPLPGDSTPLQLSRDQQHAVDTLIHGATNGFGVHLLHGVTGSGKTEVYMRLIEHVLSQKMPGNECATGHIPTENDQHQLPGAGAIPGAGELPGGAIVLVPEIALTPQTVSRFEERFDAVAVLHSGLTPAARHEQWRRIRTGQARVVVGARSAVFAPLPRVGVIIVDEEHDASYKQDQLPRYHGRDVAIKRAQLLDIPVVLGSATPSLESYHNAAKKKTYHLVKLPQRVTGLTLPKVQIVDMTQERQRRKGVHLLSHRLEDALRKTFSEKGQALVLLNRRGWAHYIACPDPGCGWLMNCHYCDAMMVYHKDQTLPTGGLLRCHHCRAEQILPRRCPLCDKRVTVFGGGTQRLEDEVADKFPGLRMLRMDSDTMRTGKDYYETLLAFGRGELDLLVGTQIIAKGLDFPNVRLVGVISADVALHMPDFRASERTFQLIAQVAGRAGRGQHPGLVVVQCYQPDDPAVTLACAHDYDAFAAREIEIRKQAGLPPYARMARIVVRDQNPEKVGQHAQRLTDQLQSFNKHLDGPVAVHGPLPCSIARIAGYHRRQIELIATGPHAAGQIQNLLSAMRQAKLLVSDIHTAIDVDPVALM